MRKIVINTCYGGFGVSNEAAHFIAERKNVQPVTEEHFDGSASCPAVRREDCRTYIAGRPYSKVPVFMTTELWNETGIMHFSDLDRDDPDLIAAVESLGDLACTPYSRLKVVEIPDNVEWEIMEYDGTEWVAEKHRTWS